MHPDRLGDLVADREQRVQRGHRVLQDHRDPLAAHLAHLLVGFSRRSSPSNSILPLTMRAAGGRMRRIVSANVLLPEPDFADDAQRLAGMDAQRHVVDRAHDPGALRRDVVGREVLQLEQRGGRYRHGPAASAHSWRSWGSSLTRSQSPRRLADSTISMMQQPGNTVSHQ